MANTNELDYSRKAADGERLELIMRQVASRFKLDGNVLAEALLDIHERLKAVEGATEELTSSDRWKAFKTVQLVKPSPSASGDTVTAIDTVAQDENGELTATKKNIRQGTTSQTGIVQLSDATNSTSTALAATANAVKTAYDLAASKQDALGISSSGSATKFLNEQGGWATVTIPDVSNKLDKDGLGDDVRVEFTEAANRTNITTGSKLSTLFGQIRKWFADLKALAFKDKVGTGDVESGTYSIGISGNAASATVLANPRNIHVDLTSNAGVNFNGSANITPGVKGVLPQAFGGTGSDTVDAQPTEGSNNMVTSGGVWDFGAPAKLGILTGSSVNVTNDFDDFDRFAVLVTSDVRLRTYWLSKKSGRVIEFYNLNDYGIDVNVVLEIGQTVVFHRQAASDVTWTNSGSTTSSQTLCSLSNKGYIKFFVTYDSETEQFDIFQNSNFAYLTGNVTSSMIGNVGVSGTSDSRTGMIYHNDIVCNHASGDYAINLERLIVGQVYRFQFLTKTGYTYLYNNGTSSMTVYSGNSSFTIGSKKNANIQASSSAVTSHTVSVVRTTDTQIYIIWGY